MDNSKIITFKPAEDTENAEKTVIMAEHGTNNVLEFPKFPKVKEKDYETLADEAYDWFITFLIDEEVKKEVKKWVLKEYKGFFQEYGFHYSLYRKEGCPTYFRMFNPYENIVVYAEIDCFSRVSHYAPAMTNFLVKNGIYAYLKATDLDTCNYILGTKY